MAPAEGQDPQIFEQVREAQQEEVESEKTWEELIPMLSTDCNEPKYLHA